MYFVNLLLEQKVLKIKKKIEKRRKEIERGEFFIHEEIWEKLNV